MATTKLLFNVDEVERLRTKIGLVSQDTNRLHLQFKGKASDWGGIPLGQELLKAQVLIKELTSEAEKLEDLIRSAVQGFQSVQAENKRQASQLSQQLGVLAGLFGSAGSRGSFGPLSIPFLAQKAVSSLIRTLTILSAKDEWSSDPVVQKLRGIIQQSGLVSIDGLAAEMKLKEIYEAREQIGKSQTAYKVYKTFGNQAQMEAAHQQAEEARKKLKSMGISEVQYQPGKDLSGYYKQSAIKACDYDPSITDKSVPLLEKEEYALLLRMAMEPGIKGEWAKQQLALIQPEATIGPVDPYNSVSEADILNRNDPAVIERLKGTYWVTLPAEEQDRIYEELKAYYEKLDKEAADKDRLARSGVGNQTVANILMGGSNMMVQAINTAAFGLPRTLGDWIAGPAPEGYVNPMDDPYGKKAGQIAGTFISIGLPWKFLSAVKTPGVVGKFSPTLLKSMVAGAISGTLEETMDAINDYRDDGKQSVGERLISVGVNTTIAGAGDALFTAASKGLASVKKLVNGSIRKVKFKEVDGTAKGKAEIDGKGKALEEVRSGGTGGTGIPKPIDPRGEPFKFIPSMKQEEIAIQTYEKLRSTSLDIVELERFSKNTGLSFEEASQLKTHVILTEHVNLVDTFNGKYYYKGYFDPDIDIAYGWEKALQDELSAEEKTWFRQLADHELAESKMMQEGLPYRDINNFNGGTMNESTKGAHELAPPQPGPFPGFKPKL